MHIEHVGVFVGDLERGTRFFETYFGGVRGERYENPRTGFSSYFLTFDSGARLEVSHNDAVNGAVDDSALGYAHVAFSVGSRHAVDELTERLRSDGYVVASGPRVTGDGYYESVVLDADGNHVEITV
ncbi:VOC family protein [Bifidobacterium choloepi]|uniref:Glyoxalase n=1 Tax=Bifidobacterium choloepi TaxID=2614131 RepID=A0A6I5NI90_9BIFI|nr:VOC family protein [Bifidobacterium choloepi]NEG70073.1 glyoxalase [Bifidobacterium choloepi]